MELTLAQGRPARQKRCRISTSPFPVLLTVTPQRLYLSGLVTLIICLFEMCFCQVPSPSCLASIMEFMDPNSIEARDGTKHWTGRHGAGREG